MQVITSSESQAAFNEIGYGISNNDTPAPLTKLGLWRFTNQHPENIGLHFNVVTHEIGCF